MGLIDRCRVLSLRVGAQRPWSNKYLPNFRIYVRISGDGNYQRSARNWRALGRQWNPSGFAGQAERPLARTKRGELVEWSPLAPRQSFLNRKNPMRQNRETKWRLTP